MIDKIMSFRKELILYAHINQIKYKVMKYLI